MKIIYFAFYRLLEYIKSGLIIVELISSAVILFVFIDSQSINSHSFLFISTFYLFVLSSYTTLMLLNRMKSVERDLFISKPLGKVGFFFGTCLAVFFIIFSLFIILLFYSLIIKNIDINLFLLDGILISISCFIFSILLSTLFSNILMSKKIVWILFPIYYFIIFFDFSIFEEELNIEVLKILNYLTFPIHHFLWVFSDGKFHTNSFYYVCYQMLFIIIFTYLIYKKSKNKNFE